MERKLTSTAKKMDHLERAKREEEVPLIQAAYKAGLVTSSSPLPLHSRPSLSPRFSSSFHLIPDPLRSSSSSSHPPLLLLLSSSSPL